MGFIIPCDYISKKIRTEEGSFLLSGEKYRSMKQTRITLYPKIVIEASNGMWILHIDDLLTKKIIPIDDLIFVQVSYKIRHQKDREIIIISIKEIEYMRFEKQKLHFAYLFDPRLKRLYSLPKKDATVKIHLCDERLFLLQGHSLYEWRENGNLAIVVKNRSHIVSDHVICPDKYMAYFVGSFRDEIIIRKWGGDSAIEHKFPLEQAGTLLKADELGIYYSRELRGEYAKIFFLEIKSDGKEITKGEERLIATFTGDIENWRFRMIDQNDFIVENFVKFQFKIMRDPWRPKKEVKPGDFEGEWIETVMGILRANFPKDVIGLILAEIATPATIVLPSTKKEQELKSMSPILLRC